MLVMQVRSSLGGVNLICPKVFKVASRMAQGETFSLVVLVLASIYKSLNEIALILRSLRLMHLFFLFITYTDG